MTHDIVVFRKWKDTGSVIALFPELPADIDGVYCDSYEHVGQHAGADYYGVIQHTTPCSLNDATALAQELTAIGYVLTPIMRPSRRHHDARRRLALHFRQKVRFS